MRKHPRLLAIVIPIYFLALGALWWLAELDPAIITILAVVGLVLALADLDNVWRPPR